MSSDVKLTVGVCVIVVAIFGSAGLVSHVMIELAGVVRADLQALRESMEAIACGELARNDDAVAGIESSNRPRQWPTADRPTAIAHPPVDASPNGRRYDGAIAVVFPRWPERCWRYRAENHPGRRVPCAFLGPAPLPLTRGAGAPRARRGKSRLPRSMREAVSSGSATEHYRARGWDPSRCGRASPPATSAPAPAGTKRRCGTAARSWSPSMTRHRTATGPERCCRLG